MHLAALCALLGSLAVPSFGFAQDVPPGTVMVATRTFLVGEVPEASTSPEDFLPLTRVSWFWELAQDDPVLDGAVVHIRQRPSPPAYLLGPESSNSRLYTNTDRVPDTLRAEGYLSTTTEGDGVPTLFLFRPDVPEPDFQVTGGSGYPSMPADRFNGCSMLVSYPLDPAITVEARLYFPPPFAELSGRFEAIADRLREVALCLDVTEAFPDDPEAALAALLKANPTLSGCEDKLSS